MKFEIQLNAMVEHCKIYDIEADSGDEAIEIALNKCVNEVYDETGSVIENNMTSYINGSSCSLNLDPYKYLQ